jgi:hypothetical protein
LAVALIGYYILGEPRQEHDSDESTVGMEEEEAQVCVLTERTPLIGANSTTDTDMVPQIYLSDLQRQGREDLLEADDHFSLDSSSPYYVDLDEELTRLTQFFEIFVMFCMVLIMDISWDSLVGGWFGYLFLFLFILSAVVLFAAKSSHGLCIPVVKPDMKGEGVLHLITAGHRPFSF